MNRNSEDLERAQRWTVGVVAAVVLYVLSPFPVFWAISRAYGRVDNAEPLSDFLFEIAYRPLVMAAIEWEPVAKFYLGGFDLLGVK